MPVTFTATRALLSTMATTLSTEATSAGLTSLATGLTNLSTEILTTNSAITEREFFGGGSTSFTATGGTGGATPGGGSASGSGTDNDSAALVWAQMLLTASDIIATKNINSIRDHFVANDSTKFWSNISNITSELQNISNKTDQITSYQKTVSEKQSVIADKQTLMETYQKKLKELGEIDGIRTTTPYEIFNMVTMYKLMIEEGKILELEKINDAKKGEAYRTLQYYVNQIKKVVPKEF